ncbi:MAG: hypothetical protein IPK02_00690 [Candidatus Accumulibacter sp.]|uniref:Uncharacterized protein n=1 Tax=Candidatus Accumulibacter affinis TaxID=2954384 RepID=A0A935T7A2_9PROT|nr:hypothetical protein [Candidatus Accumulibacter affinis]
MKTAPVLLVTLAVLVAPVVCEAASFKCMMGISRCIRSQGTEIPSKKAIEAKERSQGSTQQDTGLAVLRMTDQQIIDRAGDRLTPLTTAWLAYDYLYDSPLLFDRDLRPLPAQYPEIKRSCAQLERDFANDAKWTK